MDVIMAQNALDHGRYHCWVMDVWAQNMLNHGRHDGWAADAPCSEHIMTMDVIIAPPHECSPVRLQQTMDVIMVGP